ncbi:hypothetical protein ACFL3G_05280 [Planctomycetota bacterium]
MHLMKWFRKNKNKLMAVVVIILLFGFIGGSFLRQLGERRTGQNKTIAHYGQKQKITNYDLAIAQREIEILQRLGAAIALRNILLPAFRVPDLHAVLINELLFSNRQLSPDLIGKIKQTARSYEYNIGDELINDIYDISVPLGIYWILLETEAQQAGVVISNESSGRTLGTMIPNLFGGVTYPQYMRSVMEQFGISEQEILTVFSKLLAVMEYSRMICENQNITISQARHNISTVAETVDVEFVQFKAESFAQLSDEPTDTQIQEQFQKYKNYFAGVSSEVNPYGFGYKLPETVTIEYIALKLDDVSKIIALPTAEDAEEYYRRNRQQFTEQVPIDANDPNSELTTRIKTYAEVADIISEALTRNKITTKAVAILQDGRSIVEASLEQLDTDSASLTAEQYANLAGDYEKAAEKLSDKYRIKLYAGKTGRVSPVDLQDDEYLGRLYMTGAGYNLVSLSRIVFSIDELKLTQLSPFEVAEPRMYETIGPLRDISDEIMVLARIVEAEAACPPQDINQTFSTKAVTLNQSPEQPTDDVYSVREKVVEDLKNLSAMETAKNKSDEFVKLIVKEGWDQATESFNKRYGEKDTDSNEPTFKIETRDTMQRISKAQLQTFKVQSEANPLKRSRISQGNNTRLFIDQLYSTVPADANSLDTVPYIMQFKPEMSYYCLKSLSVNRIDMDQYISRKAGTLYKEDIVNSQSLAAVHYNPANILARTRFEFVEQKNKDSDTEPIEGEN